MSAAADKLTCALVLVTALCAVGRIAAAADQAGANGAAENIPPERAITDSERDHWAYRPLADVPVPTVADADWSANPVDRFIKATLDEHGLSPLPRAGRATLLRRVTFDLTGLPPTSAEVTAFLADSAPDAYERAVNRLLASAAYGERFAQHWLDLARFAETDGFEFDAIRPHAWRYRDWVIEALNRDMPFDGFVRLQIAGDEISDAPEAAIATGFLLCGPDMPDLNLQEERRHVVLNEITSTVGAAFLGLQIGCAQCHDHKYDPLTQHDFYRLRAFFEPAQLFRDHAIPSPAERAARQAAESAWTPDDHRGAKRLRELEDTARKRFRDKNPDERPTAQQLAGELSEQERAEQTRLAERMRQLPVLPELPLGRVLRDGEAQPCRFYVRGDFRQPGPELSPGIPQVLSRGAPFFPAATSENSAGSRAALADWLVAPANPLTARVMANRLWQWHFGMGLTGTPSDFGVMGTAPTHPALLDWLARRFVTEGWSMKAMHRLLVTSRSYQSASAPFDHAWTTAAESIYTVAVQQDPHNALLWRRNRARLEGEAVRDAMLAAGEQLSSRRGGPGVRAPLPREITASLLKDQWQVSGDEEDHRRRSIYLFVRRNLRYPLFDVFDRPDTNASCPARHESTTAPQSLVLLNSEFSLQSARELADRIVHREPTHRARQIHEAYLRIFGRQPTTGELSLGEEFLVRQGNLLRTKTSSESDSQAASALTDLCLALFNANEFVYVD